MKRTPSRGSPVLPTRVGHAEWGDNRFRGHSVARDLAGQESLAGLLALAIGGRRLDREERGLLDDVAAVVTVGDPRIWPLKLARLTACYGGCLAGVAAATICLDGAKVGPPATGLAAEVLVDLHARLARRGARRDAHDPSVLERECQRMLEARGRLFGFGVAFRPRDERITMLSARVAARGRSELPYWRLFVRVGDVFRRIHNLEPNVGLGAAAVCLDMGFTPAQIGPLMMALGASDFWSNAFEGAEQAPAVLRRLPSTNVRYVGPEERLTERAARRR